MPQSLANIPVHLVFSTLGRAPKITADVREELWAYMVGVLRNHECPPIQVGGVEDHVHLLFALSRKMALSDVVKTVKTSSSRWLKTKQSHFSDFAWQEGFGAFGVCQDAISSLTQYIQHQEEHHHKATFQDEFRTLCREAGLEWDERFVWQ